MFDWVLNTPLNDINFYKCTKGDTNKIFTLPVNFYEDNDVSYPEFQHI